MKILSKVKCAVYLSISLNLRFTHFWFSGVFSGYKMRKLSVNGLMKLVTNVRSIHNDWQHHKHSHGGDVYFTD